MDMFTSQDQVGSRPFEPHHLPRPTGEFHIQRQFASRSLPDPRDVIVYLPPGYSRDPSRRYPVLYMHDGQNLFDGATSYIPGMDWGIGATAQRLIEAEEIEPLIVVGIYNAGLARADEYTPTRDARVNAGGKAASYAHLLTEELKPMVDTHYRTLSDRANTGIGGSSLGGLVTLYLGLNHHQTFGKLAVLSPSVWWDNRVIVRDVEALKTKLDLRIWLDMGTAEGERALHGARHLRDSLTGKGWVDGEDLRYYEAEGGQHNEEAWGRRMNRVLTHLFPAKKKGRLDLP